MEDFIVLGFVPGTSIQIDFYVWLLAASILVLLRLIMAMHRYHTLRNLIILLIIRRQIHQQQAK
jgi:hypothetical protein